MLIPAYYIIKPVDALRRKLIDVGLNTDLIDLLCEMSFWNHNRASDNEEDILEVKLLFLMSILTDYLDKELYEKIFGEAQIKADIFDKWWTIERYFVDEHFSDVESRVNPAVAKLVSTTGNRGIDSWIEKLQEKPDQP